LELIININGNLEKNKFFEIWRILAIFSMENPLYRSKSYFSGRNLARFRQKGKKKKEKRNSALHARDVDWAARKTRSGWLPQSSVLHRPCKNGELCALLVQKGIPLLPRRRISKCFGNRERIYGRRNLACLGCQILLFFFPAFGAGVFWWSLEEQNWRRWCFEEVLSCQRRREIFQDALFWNRLLRLGGFTCLCARRVRSLCVFGSSCFCW